MFDLLSTTDYPGRGMVFGQTADGSRAFIAYFIMGRSENSRNRIFAFRQEGIAAEPFDATKVSDPSLILYSPVCRVDDGNTAVTNGDHTNTIVDFLRKGKTFEEAMRTRTFEPDAPHYTPRIAGLLTTTGSTMAYKLCIVKTAGKTVNGVRRFFYEYPEPEPGEGHYLHTYDRDADPLPSFEGEPKRMAIPNVTVEEAATTLWNALHAQNRVSLFVRHIELGTGRQRSCVINQRNGETLTR